MSNVTDVILSGIGLKHLKSSQSRPVVQHAILVCVVHDTGSPIGRVYRQCHSKIAI